MAVLLSLGSDGRARIMAPVQGDVWIDSEQPLARVSVYDDSGEPRFIFHPDAYSVLAFYGMVADVLDVVGARGPGEYVIPRSVIDREAAEDVERHLDYMSSNEDTDGVSSNEDTCVLPTCIQDGVDRKRGFLLCAEHAGALQSWDDLVDA